MAAQLEPIARGPELVDLRRVSAAELSPLLLEESTEWLHSLYWDFSRSADLVRRFADMRALDGTVLIQRGEVAGYCYSVLEDHKGLIGDLYVRPPWRDGEQEVRLFRSVLDHLINMQAVRRIESQLMTVNTAVGRAIQRERFVRVFERMLMVLDPASMPQSSADQTPRQPLRSIRMEPWSDIHLEAAASIISLAYHDHVDGQINDQYRSLAGARRFLHNIVQFPGCGMFFRPASFIAVDAESGWAAGTVLASFVAAGVGHITQLCVAPKYRGLGIGKDLLRRAVAVLTEHGASRISLTVTLGNKEAIQLYERCNFRDLHHFFAYVWESI